METLPGELDDRGIRGISETGALTEEYVLL
jgi:hypothetical protein